MRMAIVTTVGIRLIPLFRPSDLGRHATEAFVERVDVFWGKYKHCDGLGQDYKKRLKGWYISLVDQTI